MPVLADQGLQQSPQATSAILRRIAARQTDGRVDVGGYAVAQMGLAFAHRVAWLRGSKLRAMAPWQACLVFTGVRWLVVGDGQVLGAITLWQGNGASGWATDWSGWATAMPDAVRVAAARNTVAAQDMEPVLVRIRALRQAALWLRPHDCGAGHVLPLPPACAPLQSLTMMTQDAYLAAAQRLMHSAAAAPARPTAG